MIHPAIQAQMSSYKLLLISTYKNTATDKKLSKHLSLLRMQ